MKVTPTDCYHMTKVCILDDVVRFKLYQNKEKYMLAENYRCLDLDLSNNGVLRYEDDKWVVTNLCLTKAVDIYYWYSTHHRWSSYTRVTNYIRKDCICYV